MAELISSWAKDVQSVPTNYIQPPWRRPEIDVPILQEIPVIDFSLAFGSKSDRANLIKQMIKALEEQMIFQVINHGVPEKVMKDAMAVYNEFFNMPAEDKEKYISEGIYDKKPVWLYTSAVNTKTEPIHNWKDALGHCVYPIEQTMNSWPDQPARYRLNFRDVVADYATRVRNLSQTILELIAEGLGLEKGYFTGKLTDGLSFVVNYYPPCPDPSLTVGLGVHHDPNLITLLQQDMFGLQILKDRKWYGVECLPNAFVVHNACQLEFITNGKLKSLLHRAVTNSESDRTSIGIFINPSYDATVEPAKAITNDSNPPKYRVFTYGEFMQSFASIRGLDSPFKAFELCGNEMKHQPYQSCLK